MIIIYKIIATIFGVGYLPYMPGTWGTFAGFIPLFFIIKLDLSIQILMIGAASLFLLGWFSSQKILTYNNFADSDPSYIVIDEVAGLWVAAIIVYQYFNLNYTNIILIFLLFRLFDILKPWPIGWIDHYLSQYKSTASFGVMIDDVLAGIMAAITTLIMIKYFF